MSEYEKIVKGKAKRGRKPLPPEEKELRNEFQRQKNRFRAEVRRRALAVLAAQNQEKFQEVMQIESQSLLKHPRFQALSDYQTFVKQITSDKSRSKKKK